MQQQQETNESQLTTIYAKKKEKKKMFHLTAKRMHNATVQHLMRMQYIETIKCK